MPRRSRRSEPDAEAGRPKAAAHRVLVRVLGGPYPGAGRAMVARRGRAMLALLARVPSELSIVLCDDGRMRELNRAHRRIDRPTDVLSFAQNEGESGPATTPLLLGDVVVSVPTAARQARGHGRLLRDELTMLLAHGLLHLFGWGHDTVAAERAMAAETERLCRAAVPRREKDARRAPRAGR